MLWSTTDSLILVRVLCLLVQLRCSHTVRSNAQSQPHSRTGQTGRCQRCELSFVFAAFDEVRAESLLMSRLTFSQNLLRLELLAKSFHMRTR